VIRFPNPGSDIRAFIASFQAVYHTLREQYSFDLDDVTSALIQRNLVTSSGHVGQEALRRSTHQDRSLDPLFNQSKMYSELYRVLGWVHHRDGKKQRLSFSYLGHHVGSAHDEPRILVQESLLGIAYPNPLVNIHGTNKVRPISLILRTADALGGNISRDEMILGPFDIPDDKDDSLLAEMVSNLRSMRSKPGNTEQALSVRASQLGVQVNTLQNYTRFPIGVLRWAGWLVQDSLTSAGREMVERLGNVHDIRASDLERFSEPAVHAFCQVAALRIFERAGYDISDFSRPVSDLERQCSEVLVALAISDTNRILFSPFQEYSPEHMTELFPAIGPSAPVVSKFGQTASHLVSPPIGATGGRSITTSKLLLKESSLSIRAPRTTSGVAHRIIEIASARGADPIAAAAELAESYRLADKETFYPVVAELFRALGYDCELSRAGANYQRMDALIRHATDSIPIEIKSPSEEEFISVKGVRQALENKIVVLSRGIAPTRVETTSLLVGYSMPADRSEVNLLVHDIHQAYGLSIGIIDFRSLALLAALHALQGRQPDFADISQLRGGIELGDS